MTFKVLDLANSLKRVFVEKAEELAWSTGWKKRRKGQLSGMAFALTLVMGWWRKPASSLGELSQSAASAGVKVSSQGIDQRFTEEAVVMMQRLLQEAVKEIVVAEPVVIELLSRFEAVEVGDSSSIALPAQFSKEWPGCGGGNGGGQAALKLHVSFDLKRGRMWGPLLTSGRHQDKASPLQDLDLLPGSLSIRDLGFFGLGHFKSLSERGVYWLRRLQVQTAVFLEQSGQRLDVLAYLLRHRGETLDLAVRLGVQEQLKARLLAVRVPLEVAAERRRRLHLDAKSKGQKVSQKRLELCDWTILVTNVPTELLSIEEALVLLRARWQIELLFKLWKQHGLLDESRSEKPQRILCEIYAKLLALLIQHWCSVTALWSVPNRSLVKAAQTLRDFALALTLALREKLDLLLLLEQICCTLFSGCRNNPRRKQPNTNQLLLDPMLNSHLPASMNTALNHAA